MAKQRGPGDWKVDTTPPQVVRGGRPSVDPGIEKLISEAAETGEWYSKEYDTERAARLAARRVKYHAARRELVVQTRCVVTNRDIRLWIRVRKEDQDG